jgi:hypothetical protein
MRCNVTRRNGCHNRPEGRPYHFGQDGYRDQEQPDGSIARVPVWVIVYDNVMSTDCKHSMLFDDPGCDGCRWDQRKNDKKDTQ